MTAAVQSDQQAQPRPTRRRRYRMAAIDVGTNSMHMIVVESLRHGYRVIDKEKEMVQLGRDSLEGRPLTDDAIARGVATLKSMADIARRWKVDDIFAVATSAIREAPNRRRFITAAEKASGIKVRVISGEEEADYIYRAVRSAVDFHGGTAVSIDIGGGSVELIVGTPDEVFFTHSEPVGALRMAQKFGDDVHACRTFVRKALKKTMARIASLGFDFSIGTSGTIVTLAMLASEENGMSSGLRWLSRSRLHELIELMTPLPVEERARRFSLDSKRAETILVGGIVLEQIMLGLDVEQIRACDVALREGIVEKAFDAQRQPQTGGGSIRHASVVELARRSDVDRTHAANVARLALRIFDQTQELHLLRTGERELLESAALLHEAGMHVSFQGHHKHSYYLICHAGLRGFTGDQVAIVANVARYYRKATPAEEHANFAALSPGQRETVSKLSAILRIAAALDRGRRGAIRDVGVEVGEESVSFELRRRDEAEVEIASAAKKGKYFAKVFGRRVDFEIA
jgi:exopolyphosphatase/guanosine-5'-triphosphate,3'-diphosphate pyrophosphatase